MGYLELGHFIIDNKEFLKQLYLSFSDLKQEFYLEILEITV